jgi:hypothetical protein
MTNPQHERTHVPDDRIDTSLILDTMLPGDAALDMPKASTIGFDDYLLRYDAKHVEAEFGALLARVAQSKFGQPFSALDADARLAAINACRAANIRLFSAFLTHVLRAYYTDRMVLVRLSAGAVPPFPTGNALPEDDWTILERVYERGPIYRDAGDIEGARE